MRATLHSLSQRCYAEAPANTVLTHLLKHVAVGCCSVPPMHTVQGAVPKPSIQSQMCTGTCPTARWGTTYESIKRSTVGAFLFFLARCSWAKSNLFAWCWSVRAICELATRILMSRKLHWVFGTPSALILALRSDQRLELRWRKVT